MAHVLALTAPTRKVRFAHRRRMYRKFFFRYTTSPCRINSWPPPKKKLNGVPERSIYTISTPPSHNRCRQRPYGCVQRNAPPRSLKAATETQFEKYTIFGIFLVYYSYSSPRVKVKTTKHTKRHECPSRYMPRETRRVRVTNRLYEILSLNISPGSFE